MGAAFNKICPVILQKSLVESSIKAHKGVKKISLRSFNPFGYIFTKKYETRLKQNSMKDIQESRQQPVNTTTSKEDLEQMRKQCLEKALPFIQKNIKFLTKKTIRKIAAFLDLPKNVAYVSLVQMISLENVMELINEFDEVGVCQNDLEKLEIDKEKILPKTIVKVHGKKPIKYIKIYDIEEVLAQMINK